jgi:4-amino-4-deoxy-L-arabinose transferase-like glycosyltransferase
MIRWWWYSLLLKLGLVTAVPLTADENYYWVWSQNLQLSYYDHPPFVAWLFKLGTYLPSVMLKWPAVLMAHSALLVWSLFLKNIGFNQEQIKTWFLLAVMAPLVGMSGMILTPDLPLLFFLSLSIYWFERALTTGKIAAYAFFGLAIGLGFTSKYHIVLILPGLLLYLIFSGQVRSVQWKWLPIVLMTSLLGAAPVLIWNYQNQWASFQFQLHHGMGKKAWKPIWPLEYLLSILLFILPFYWLDFVRAVLKNKQKLLIYLSLPILAFFLFTSLRSKVEANWSQVAFLPVLSLIAYYDRSRWKPKLVLGVWGISLLVICGFWNRPWFPGCPDKLCEPLRYQSIKEVAQSYKPFRAANYQMASFLWFQLKEPVFKLYDMSRRDFFDNFAESRPQENSFYLAKHLETDLPSWLSEEHYQTEKIKNIDADIVLLRVYR